VFVLTKSIRDPSSLADYGLQVALWVNVVTLPVAKMSAVREWCLALALGCWLFRSVRTRRWRLTATSLWPWLLLFTAAILASIPFAADWRYSLSEFRGEWLKGMIWFFLVVHAVDEPWKVKGLLAAFWAGATLMISYGVFHGILAWNWALGLISEPSLAAGVGTLSSYLVLIFGFLWLPFRLTRNRWWWVWSVVMIAGAVFLLIMSTQRAAWLAMAMMVVLSVMVIFRHRWWSMLTAVGVTVLFIAWLNLLPPELWIRADEKIRPIRSLGQVTAIVSHPFSAVGSRGQIWLDTLRLASRHPLVGVGYGRGSLGRADMNFHRYPLLWHGHNTFLNVAAETGIIGLLAFLAVMIALLIRSWRDWRRGIGLRSYVAGVVLVAMIGFLFRNLFNDFLIDDTGLLFWIICALLYVTAWDRSPERPAPGPA
jgi:O-antigen ligase